jgi:hypothetical protein
MTLPVGKIKNPPTDDPLTLIPRTTPYAIYDVNRNRGTVAVGISADIPRNFIAN